MSNKSGATIIILKITSTVFVLFFLLPAASKIPPAEAQIVSKDAIAIRIIPNPDNYSPQRWYRENKFSGSPQSLIVDGYEAIRDGRSVYVGAANVDDKGTVDTSDDTLYTNIYLISFNQDSEQATRDIFSQVISYWKFNINIITPGTCLAISPLDEDPPGSPVCILDSDCKQKQYCNSPKSEVIRDVKRLADLVEIKIALDKYKTENGYYPKLNAGSYLANKTISTWPSWQKLLSQELKMDLPLDPINKLGECDARFYPITCWDEKAKEFADSDPADSALNLPDGSKSYVYSVDPDGLSYNVCGAMESEYVEGTGSGACSSAGTVEIIQSGINNPPIFVDQNLTGYAGMEYKGFIMAKDADGDTLSWTIDTLSTDWSSWSNPPILQNQPTPNQIGVYAAKAGDTDVYPIQVTISDGAHTVSKVFTVQIINTPPFVSSVNSTVVVGYDLVPMIFTATDNEGHDIILNIGNILPVGLTGTQVNNTYEITGIPTGNAPQTYTHENQVIATDEYGAVSSKNFYINITNTRPVINPVNCVNTVRTGDYFECQVTGSDADGHDFSFSMNSGPPSLGINADTGLISGTLGGGDEGTYSLNVIATDEYGAVSLTKIFVLNVLNFCGDGELQKPNTELKGGPNDDGFEQCDDANDVNDDACMNNCGWSCKEENSIDFTLGSGDAINYDNNVSTDFSTDVPNGDYLKLAKSMPTPYIYIADSKNDQVFKIRTFDGCKRIASGWNCGVIETRGQLVEVFATGDNPSRTAVNAETGDVWIASRGSGEVHKFNIEGTLMKTCFTGIVPREDGPGGLGPRGIAIEENGDVWIGNFYRNNAVKISGDDSSCTILQTVDIGSSPYGLAIDNDNNVWSSSQNLNGLSRINTETFVVDFYPLPLGFNNYGITVDPYGNVWIGITEGGVGKLTKGTANIVLHNLTGDRITGITADLDGNIWGSGYVSNLVYKLDQNANILPPFPLPSGGSNPHGICGDSENQVWSVNRFNGNVRAFDLSGIVNSTYFYVGDDHYTYSDMTGLNRAMIFRSGTWSRIIDGNFDDQHWGKISWQQDIPTDKQGIEVFVKNANFDIESASWMTSEEWNALPFLNRVGRFVEIKVKMKSSEQGITPVLWDLNMNCD